MKKILFINLATYSQIGGIENYNKNIINSLSEISKAEIDVVSVYDNKSPDILNVNFHNFNKNKLDAALFVIKKSYQYEKIITSHINILPILIIVKIINPKIKIYMSAHGIEVWKKFNLFYKYFLSKFTILPVSTYSKKIMMKLNNLKESNFEILFNCIDFKNMTKTYQNVYDSNEFNILSVTRLNSSDSYKGVDSIIKTIPLAIKKIPNLKYTVIGKGDDKDRLLHLANKLDVKKHIEFKGFVEDIEPYYQYCDLFVLPSKGEGFGIVYIEAMKYKKPCIACDEGGQTYVVLDNQTGYLCNYDNQPCLLDKIVDLYNNPHKKLELGGKGYKHLLHNFTYEKFKNRLKEILDG